MVHVVSVSPRKVARDFKLDYDYFRKAFTKQVGIPPSAFRLNARGVRPMTCLTLL